MLGRGGCATEERATYQQHVRDDLNTFLKQVGGAPRGTVVRALQDPRHQQDELPHLPRIRHEAAGRLPGSQQRAHIFEDEIGAGEAQLRGNREQSTATTLPGVTGSKTPVPGLQGPGSSPSAPTSEAAVRC